MVPSQAEPEARTRIVLLGASNATIGLRAAVDALRARYGPALEIVCALGHGRSYGTPSSFLVRRLPGIVGSGLWSALEARPARAQHVLLTDIGNDLAFGVEPRTILGWLETVLARLEPGAASVVLGALPLENLRALSAFEFGFWSRFLFPRHGLQRELVLERAERLDAGVRALARERGHRLVAPAADWYGRDPIHIRPSARARAWQTYVGPPGPARAPSPVRMPTWWRLVPERRWILGVPGGRAQPALQLADGTSVALH